MIHKYNWEIYGLRISGLLGKSVAMVAGYEMIEELGDFTENGPL